MKRVIYIIFMTLFCSGQVFGQVDEYIGNCAEDGLITNPALNSYLDGSGDFMISNWYGSTGSPTLGGNTITLVCANNINVGATEGVHQPIQNTGALQIGKVYMLRLVYSFPDAQQSDQAGIEVWLGNDIPEDGILYTNAGQGQQPNTSGYQQLLGINNVNNSPSNNIPESYNEVYTLPSGYHTVNVLFTFTGFNDELMIYPVTSSSSSDVVFNLVIDYINIYCVEMDYTLNCEDDNSITTQFSIPSALSDAPISWNFGDGSPTASTASVTHTFEQGGEYTVTVDIDGHTLSLDIYLECGCKFSPTACGKYWVSGWVNVEQINQVITYDQTGSGGSSPAITVEFTGSTDPPVTLYPTGEIIDGWQRVVGSFVIPQGTTQLNLVLKADGSYTTYFDDIRLHPFNASMKSYVYDGDTFWLTSELDGNNYATFYEYDNEGGLIRIKKETSRGIVTIQETRSSTPKP